MLRHATRAAAVARSATGKRVAPAQAGAVRFLNLHEYQSRDLMEQYGVRVQKGHMADSADSAFEVASRIKRENPGAELILKAQIHAGGRGKGTFTSGLKGGVKICSEPGEVRDFASQMLGGTLVTHQTGAEGQQVHKVLVNEGVSIQNEFYFAILMDRAAQGPCLVASAQGGMDIEEVAAKTPEAIVVQPIDIMEGPQPEQTARVAEALGFEEGSALSKQAQEQMVALYNMFLATDATQVEINPFAVASVPGSDAGEQVFCIDAKLNFDDNASYRQAEIYGMRDTSMEDPRDVRAEEVGLNYIGLDGNIGCMVNGAGLAMATMDIIKLKGGNPANFLDVGGGANAEQVTEALKILTSDPNVKGILVNIFGGIMKCDTIAEGIVQGASQVDLNIPLIVRLEGTNVERGKEILEQSSVNIITADDLDDAAAKAVGAI